MNIGGPHGFKTAFSTIFCQSCYLRMGQSLSGHHIHMQESRIFLRGQYQVEIGGCNFRNIRGESSVFESFLDDLGGIDDFTTQYQFLHEKYFPRLLWERLNLNPEKRNFFMDRIEAIGFATSASGLRPSKDKAEVMRNYPSPTNEELERFIYLTVYLRRFIPGRAELIRIMKSAILTEIN
jgi:hypothetical protein